MTAAAGNDESNDAADDACLLAACTSAILLHLEVRHATAQGALTRPMAVLVGSNEDFAFFDAPVVSAGEARALMPEPDALAQPPNPPPPAEKGFLGRWFGR